ncbi:MAG: hypothetical protein K6A32_05440 [Bacteroidales bacterium]|nr:hypothetical protein [Bacteroidales bacterium]
MLAAASLMGVTSCSDAWDEHYQGTGMDTASDAPTLLEQVKSNSSLSGFLKVLEATGYDQVLSSPQMLTVWAPAISETVADSLIAVYRAERSAGVRDDDNSVISQFVQNHIALFNHSVSPVMPDTILKMLNGKNLAFTSTSLDGMSFSDFEKSSNGVFYTISEPLNFHPNIREYFQINSGYAGAKFDSIYHFIKAFDKYTLDESSSVAQGIVDGRTVYADSVMRLSNEILSSYRSFIQREDSNYTFVAPTNDVWATQYARYSAYFNFPTAINFKDSLQNRYTNEAIFQGLTFNNNIQKSEQDSVVNTMYIDNYLKWGLNMFETPWQSGGIYAGLDSATCSNGRILIDDAGKIDPRKTFFYQRSIMANRSNYYWMPKTVADVPEDKGTMTPRATYSYITNTDEDGNVTDTAFVFDNIFNNFFIEIASTGTGNAEIYYELPNTFSGVYYNVYAVMCPAIAANPKATDAERLPVKFQVYYMHRLDEPRKKKNNEKDPNEDVNYPASWGSALKVSDQADALGYKDASNAFKTIADQVCIIPIDIARQTTFSSYNQDTYAMRYRFETKVKSSELDRTWNNHFRINRLIYIPFDTEEEAKNFNLSDLNDYQN